jgi:hypothetical protein
MCDHVWKKAITTVPDDKVDKAYIFAPKMRREWDKSEKTCNIMTDLVEVDPTVLDYPRDLFARWYDIEYHGMGHVWRINVASIFRFKHLKIYYSCALGRREHQELGYLTPIKYTV